MGRSGRAVLSTTSTYAWLGAALACGAVPAHAQRGGSGTRAAQGGSALPPDTTTGFAIHDPTTIQYCSDCHLRDSAGYMQRISYERKTPEGWEMTVRRMASINKVNIDPAAARTIVRYLADHQGLAPDELRPGRFEVERRMIDYRYTADPRTETTCRACHSMGRVITQRRTRGEWELLVATHRALYPDADFQAFRRGGPASDTAPAPHPMDVAIAHLAKTFPLRTPQWAAWSATMRAPRLEGTWLLSGTEPGRGAFYGRMSITRGAGDAEFVTQTTYRYADAGPIVTRTGRSIVYTGFQWRGRSTERALRGRDSAGLREVMLVEPGWQEISGRWFTGGYDELGMDVSLKRLGSGPVIAGVTPHALRTGTQSDITILGANFPRDVPAAAIDFGPGVTVDRVVRAAPDSLVVRVAVASTAQVGARDLFAAGASLRGASVVFDHISRITVVPTAGLARVGGVVFPKHLQQFDAIAYHNGPDGRPNTDDDIEIGRVDATWSLEEYATTYDDDDVKFVGTLSKTGLFTPNVDGPNPKRSGNRDNVGDVWVVATYTPPDKSARPLRARALLVVTVPLYVQFRPWKTQP